MALSSRSVSRLADSLQEDFVKFLGDEYFDELSELLSEAANAFIDKEIGKIDDELYYDLALCLIEGVEIS